MARTKTTYDVFSAIGEPKRRALIEKLIVEEMSVNELVNAMQWRQPMVSKHLAVLKDVGIVTERRLGRSRIYQVRPEKLRPIQEWIHQFEKYWGGTMDQLDVYLEDIQRKGDRNDKQ
jgi:DNA-binding transcriptional ArsR family regulator